MKIKPAYRIHWLSILVLVLSVSPAFLLSSCKKFDPEADLVIASDHIEVIDQGEYRLHGNLINIGDDHVISHGFLWDVGRIPDLGSFVIDLGEAEAEQYFSGDIFVLGENTTYYMRAFATTPTETKYGSTLEFTTGAAPKVPFDNITREQIRTVPLSDVQSTAAIIPIIRLQSGQSCCLKPMKTGSVNFRS